MIYQHTWLVTNVLRVTFAQVEWCVAQFCGPVTCALQWGLLQAQRASRPFGMWTVFWRTIQFATCLSSCGETHNKNYDNEVMSAEKRVTSHLEGHAHELALDLVPRTTLEDMEVGTDSAPSGPHMLNLHCSDDFWPQNGYSDFPKQGVNESAMTKHYEQLSRAPKNSGSKNIKECHEIPGFWWLVDLQPGDPRPSTSWMRYITALY